MTSGDGAAGTRLRRVTVLPVVLAVQVLLLCAAPGLLVVAALVGVVARSDRAVRSVLLVVAYAAIELWTVARIRRGPLDWDELTREVLSIAYTVVRAVLDVPVVLAEGSATPERLISTGRPIVVLARHCGPGDSLFIAWLLAVHYRRRPHIVLKSALRVDPVVDLAGDHLRLCFVRGRGTRARIGQLAATMADGDALLLFPEGGNFSWPRWRRAILALRESGAARAARRALRRTHTLPPHHGGALAALVAAPTADCLVLAHAGFTADGRDRPWWRLPVHRPFLVHTRLIPAAEVPRTEERLPGWLDAIWSSVDSWVDTAVTGAADPLPSVD